MRHFQSATFWVSWKVKGHVVLGMPIRSRSSNQQQQRRQQRRPSSHRHNTPDARNQSFLCFQNNNNNDNNNNTSCTGRIIETLNTTAWRRIDNQTSLQRFFFSFFSLVPFVLFHQVQNARRIKAVEESWWWNETLVLGTSASTTNITTTTTRMEESSFRSNPLPGVVAKDNDAPPATTTTATTKTTTTTTTTKISTTQTRVVKRDDPRLPPGPRWAMAHPTVDFSGTWVPVVDETFRAQYAQYLEHCGFHALVRHVCLRFVKTTREHIEQQEQGRVLYLNGTSPLGNWRRRLVSSGADDAAADDDDDSNSAAEFDVIYNEFLDPDGAPVQVEAWWEENGTVHVSWLRNTPRVQGGEFETKRYLQRAEQDGVMELICESTFHPPPHLTNHHPHHRHHRHGRQTLKPAFVRWRYRKHK